MTTVLDLGCEAPLECRAALVSARARASEVAARLAEVYADRVLVEGDQIALRLVEPLELITVAREAVGNDRFELRGVAAARDALDMMREPVEPTRSSWRWVCDELGFELEDAVRSFVAGGGTGYLELEDDFLPRPILIVDDDGDRSVFDQDEVSISSVVFEREPTGWFVRKPIEGRSRFSRRRSRPEVGWELFVNGCVVDDGHQVRSGDQVACGYGHYARSSLEILAIL